MMRSLEDQQGDSSGDAAQLLQAALRRCTSPSSAVSITIVPPVNFVYFFPSLKTIKKWRK